MGETILSPVPQWGIQAQGHSRLIPHFLLAKLDLLRNYLTVKSHSVIDWLERTQPMKTIRISEEVWSKMAEYGKFGETPDDVLRRVLNVNGSIVRSTPTSTTISTSAGTGTLNERTVSPPTWKQRRATVVMTQAVEGDDLVIRFVGGADRRWQLPLKSDKASIRKLRDEAVAWARQNGATHGQRAAVMRALTSRGYHITK